MAGFDLRAQELTALVLFVQANGKSSLLFFILKSASLRLLHPDRRSHAGAGQGPLLGALHMNFTCYEINHSKAHSL